MHGPVLYSSETANRSCDAKGSDLPSPPVESRMRRIVIILLLVGAGVAAAYLLNRSEGRTQESAESTAPPPRAPADSWTISRGSAPFDKMADAGVEDTKSEPFYFDLAELDFSAIRARTPDSLYWLMAAPTDDSEVLAARAREREERNRQYGKVVSNTATVEEINDYYAYRRKLSEDYIEVLQLILDEHGDELSERHSGLFELTISMHTARLAEIPSKIDDALRRKLEYDQAKTEWQKQKTDNAP